jgi:hypothetical protein
MADNEYQSGSTISSDNQRRAGEKLARQPRRRRAKPATRHRKPSKQPATQPLICPARQKSFWTARS